MSLPTHARCAQIVDEREKFDATRIIADFRENEKIFHDNDFSFWESKLKDHDQNPMRKLTPTEWQHVHTKLVKCDRVACLLAADRVQDARIAALELSKQILTRLVRSFDRELNEIAVACRGSSDRIGIPLFDPTSGQWELWSDKECLRRHAWRECARNLVCKIECQHGVDFIVWVATGEPVPTDEMTDMIRWYGL